jgi:DnaJ-class molecular chaperone
VTLLRHQFSGDPWGPCSQCEHPAYHRIHQDPCLDCFGMGYWVEMKDCLRQITCDTCNGTGLADGVVVGPR